MHSLHVGNGGSVVAVLVVDVDLEVGHGGEVAGLRHHIAAVAHEVVLATVKGGVVWVSRGYAGGCSCKHGGGRNVLLSAWIINIFHHQSHCKSARIATLSRYGKVMLVLPLC